jgi:nitrogen fixation/metabolism regulation signal transduction histidine kinase
MALTRKKYVLDKKFQFRISMRAIILPLITTLAICAILIYFASNTNQLINENNKNITAIIDTQDSMFDMFMAIPALQDPNNPIVQKCDRAFKENLKITNKINDNHERIKKNSMVVLYILIAMTIVQTAIIFFQFIFFSHKISGPIHVMTNYMKEYRSGKRPEFRPLRKHDELREFYDEFCETMNKLTKK